MSDTEGRDDRFDWSAPQGSSPQASQPPQAPPSAPAAPQWDQPGAAQGYGYPPAQGSAAWGEAPPPGPVFAHWGLRVGAVLVDWVIPTVALVVVIVVAVGIASTAGDSADFAATAVIVLGYLAMLGFWVWNSCLRQGRTGRSVGKSVMGTALVRASDGSYVGGGLAFVRELAHFLDGLPCYLGYLWPLWDSRRQTFADKICGTVVVRTR